MFKMVSFPNIWCSFFFERSFAQNNSKWLVQEVLACLFELYFLPQNGVFAKAIAFAWWPILKMVLLLEYLVFFFCCCCFVFFFPNGFPTEHSKWFVGRILKGFLNNFWSKVKILQGLYPLHDNRSSKWSHFRIFGVLFF